MTYLPDHPTKRDEIRFLVFDTSEPHLVPDVTIDAELVRQQDWRLAAAPIAEGVAVQLERKLTGVNSSGDSLQWGDRAKSLRTQAHRWRAEVANEAASDALDDRMVSVGLARADASNTTPEYSRRRTRGF